MSGWLLSRCDSGDGPRGVPWKLYERELHAVRVLPDRPPQGGSPRFGTRHDECAAVPGWNAQDHAASSCEHCVCQVRPDMQTIDQYLQQAKG